MINGKEYGYGAGEWVNTDDEISTAQSPNKHYYNVFGPKLPAPKPEKSTLVVEEQEITNDEEPTFLALSDEDDDSSESTLVADKAPAKS